MNYWSSDIKTNQCGFDITRTIFFKVLCSILPAVRLTWNTFYLQLNFHEDVVGVRSNILKVVKKISSVPKFVGDQKKVQQCYK
jgi:predicted secreted Zn-dependent protease